MTKKFMLTLAIMFTISTEAMAEEVCGPHKKIVKDLESKYNERRTGVGIGGNGTLVELFTSEESGTWTFMYTRPNGLTCLLGAGRDWEDITYEADPEDDHDS